MAGRAGPSFGGPGFARAASVVLLLLLLQAQLGRLEGWAQPSSLIATDLQPDQTETGSSKPGREQALEVCCCWTTTGIWSSRVRSLRRSKKKSQAPIRAVLSGLIRLFAPGSS